MKLTGTANILNLNGHVSPSDIKKAYHAAALKYHPHKNPAGAQMMRIINAAFEALRGFSGDLPKEERSEDSQQDYGETVNATLNVLYGLGGLSLEICGCG